MFWITYTIKAEGSVTKNLFSDSICSALTSHKYDETDFIKHYKDFF